MCLIAFAWGASERFPFVIAANRDEYLARPTAPLSQWLSPGGATILAGRDLKDGGTWMGFSPNGRFAMLTNVRNPQATPPEQPISRGGLALSWLESNGDVNAWMQIIHPSRYQGFNLIVGDWQTRQCFYLSHQEIFKPFEQLAGAESAQGAIKKEAISMPWGKIYGLSNAALDTPWPKTQRLKNALQHSLASENAEQLISESLAALADQSKAPATDLPATGVPQELESALSSIFVSYPQTEPSYGTRSSLVAVFEAGHGLRVSEITHSHRGLAAAQANATLDWR